ncbi:hypothetical protein BHM03_00011562 [Ensete ventricosum]|nr:hypothetical protein BHM03_00011562 [Ensete ventricosum]
MGKGWGGRRMRSQTCDLTLRLMCADGSAGFLSSSCPAPDIPRSTLAPKSSSGFSISPGSAPPYLYRDRLRYAEDGDGKSAPLVKPTLWTAAMDSFPAQNWRVGSVIEPDYAGTRIDSRVDSVLPTG